MRSDRNIKRLPPDTAAKVAVSADVNIIPMRMPSVVNNVVIARTTIDVGTTLESMSTLNTKVEIESIRIA